MMENSYSKFHAHTRRTTKYGGPPPPPPPSCEGIFPRDYTIVSPLVGLISAHTANFLAFNQVCITAAFVSRSSTTAHRAEMGDPGAASRRKNRFPKGGSESSVLHAAARNGDLTTVESICNANPLAVNSRDRHSRTPYPFSLVLLSSIFVFCCYHVVDSSLGSESVEQAAYCATESLTEVVRFLCKNKADVGAAAMDDTAAIHFAAQKGHLEIIRILLSSGVSVKAANRKGLTPLHYAVQGSHPELVKYLIRKGANLTAKTKAGQTPIDLASTKEVRALLVECKQPLTKDDKSTTIMEVGDSVSKEDIEENNGGSITEESANVDEEGADTKEKRRGEAAADEDSSKPKKAKVFLDHLLAENDVLGEDEE
ncbi:Ankyrin repeat [Musa troglodytarum]|uniref:Ankyrin repeat n=1 Tax=Musa troglodytarum TaxID=320322 RepID=A0A9E7JF71_9LILI|nr:Ankyrin repeat [Musa troglodytarum]